ncbi:hypothetical protein BPO_1009 [Bergeyella porcorum]|uniref:Uncharacterized protein n=1 Tax=Bergeyella porcorum TaxID=1735111 RepID=A0AAU0F6P4_9FLAO
MASECNTQTSQDSDGEPLSLVVEQQMKKPLIVLKKN